VGRPSPPVISPYDPPPPYDQLAAQRKRRSAASRHAPARIRLFRGQKLVIEKSAVRGTYMLFFISFTGENTLTVFPFVDYPKLSFIYQINTLQIVQLT
jgi:hypothetical protein